MQNGTHTFAEGAMQGADCAFCRRHEIAEILKETPHFFLAADHAPLVEGHLLVIPKTHYACYGAVPAELDEELFALKDELRRFYTCYYTSVVFWEHGVFRQTVFHAHLHCFPWGNLNYDLTGNIHNVIVQEQEDIRSWYHARGHYFYLENANLALLFAPEMDRYLHVVQQVFQQGLVTSGMPRRSPQQRIREGRPLIEMAKVRWEEFQKQTTEHASGRVLLQYDD